MDSENDNLNIISVKPKGEFSHHFQAEASLRIGQAYIEERDSHPKKLSEADLLLQIKIKLLDNSQGNFVKNNIKGLWGLILMQSGLDLKSINFEVTVENDFVNVELSCKKEELLSGIQKNNMDDFKDRINEFWTLFLNPSVGKSDVKLRLGIGPAYLFNSNTTFEQFFHGTFNIDLSGSGDEQIKSLIRPFEEELRREAQGKNDVIQEKLADPLCDYVEKNILNSSNVKVDYLYDREYLQGVIDEYNTWGYDDVRENFASTRDAKNEVLNPEMIKSLTGGFFGPYFKILSYIDFDNIEAGFWSNLDATSLKAKINLVGANEFAEKEVLCHIKSNTKSEK